MGKDKLILTPKEAEKKALYIGETVSGNYKKLLQAQVEKVLRQIREEIKGCGLTDEEIRKYYLGSSLTAVKDALQAYQQKILGRLK